MKGRSASELHSALESRAAISSRLRGKKAALFLDYDGTLTPIVSRPEDATLSGEMREVLQELAALRAVTIISGRDRSDVEALVGLGELIYAGSHGFDIRGPRGLRLEYEGGVSCLPELDEAEKAIEPLVSPIAGARVERKRFAIAIHYRNVSEAQVPDVERVTREVLARHENLRLSAGKKVFELRPDIDWDKGRALLWLLDALELDREGVVPIYMGDDVTDEDAFRAIHENGVGVVVGEPPYPTFAMYRLTDTKEVRRFLMELLRLFREARR